MDLRCQRLSPPKEACLSFHFSFVPVGLLVPRPLTVLQVYANLRAVITLYKGASISRNWSVSTVLGSAAGGFTPAGSQKNNSGQQASIFDLNKKKITSKEICEPKHPGPTNWPGFSFNQAEIPWVSFFILSCTEIRLLHVNFGEATNRIFLLRILLNAL